MARGPQQPDETPPNPASVASSSDGVGELAQAIVDLVVFVPLGFAKRARTLLPELAREGRSTAQSAQVIGKFVVPVLKKQGRRAVDRTLSDLGQRPKSTKRPGSAGSKVGASTGNVAAPSAPGAAAASLSAPAGHEPFPGYDHLGSAAVIARLGELDSGERGGVRVYEMLHRNRRTILGRLDQLDQPGEPGQHNTVS